MKQNSEKQAIQVAIASYDASWLRVAGNYLAEQMGIGHIDCYGRGGLLLAALKEGVSPQVLVMDEQLQDMDLLTFMQGYIGLHLPNQPIVIGVCSKQYLGYTGNLISLGMTDFIAKPVRMQGLHARILELYHEQGGGRVREYCEACYRNWGIEANESTAYLTDAVRVASDAVEKLALRKEIVWGVAKRHDCSVDAVDSSLRRLIDKLEQKATPEYLVFKQSIGFSNKKMAVGPLIFAMRAQINGEKPTQKAPRKEVAVAK